MVPFEIEVELNNITVSLSVEPLDYLPDAEGRKRYDIRGYLLHATLVVDIDADPDSPDFTFEAQQSIDQDFSGEELLKIIKAIRAHFNELRYPFNRLPFMN